MHSTSDTERARLMAQWLATGGADLAIPAEMPAGDDGPQAAGPTLRCGMPTTRCFVDEGLAAGLRPTQPPTLLCGDDGLQAAPTARGAYGCGFTDDGLTA